MKTSLHDFVSKENDQRIARQSEFFSKNVSFYKKEEKRFPFITISREYGCQGFDVGDLLAEELNKIGKPQLPWAVYDKELLDKVKDQFKISNQELEELKDLTKKVRSEYLEMFITTFSQTKPQRAVYKKLFKTIKRLALQGNVILIGRGSAIITKDIPKGVHIRLQAREEWKVNRIMGIEKCNKNTARKIVRERSKERESYVLKYLKVDVNDISYYDLTVNNERNSKEEIVKLILELMKLKGLIKY